MKLIFGALKNNDFRETLLASPEGTTLLGSIERQVQRFRGIPVDSEEMPPAPATVNSAENLRKWLNAQWSPKNSAQIGAVKQAIDEDVAKTGGADLFKAARALHAERKTTIDNPKGISLLNESDPRGGINQALYDEQVTKKLINMPTDQFKHIIDTYRKMPPELQDQAQQALSEIKGAIVKDVHTVGAGNGTQNGPSMWNASKVTKRLQQLNSKINIVFSPDEIGDLKTLNDVGHVLTAPSAYPGAAAQAYNYAQKGITAAIPLATGGIGASVAGVPGAMVGSGIGAPLAKAYAKRVEQSMAKKLAERLANPKPEETK